MYLLNILSYKNIYYFGWALALADMTDKREMKMTRDNLTDILILL